MDERPAKSLKRVLKKEAFGFQIPLSSETKDAWKS